MRIGRTRLQHAGKDCGGERKAGEQYKGSPILPLPCPCPFAAQRTRRLIWIESSIILGLLVWVSLEYENNPFLQSWEQTNIGPVSFLLNGTLAGLYAGTMLGFIVARYVERRTEEEKILKSLRKKTVS